MTRVLFCFNTSWFALNHRIGLLKKCQDHGLDVHIACPDGPEVKELQELGFQVHLFEFSRKGANPILELKTIWILGRIIHRVSPHLYHGFTIKPVIYGALICRFLPQVKKCFLTITGLGSAFLGKNRKSWMLQRTIQTLYKFALGSQKNQVVFQNPTDLEEFNSRQWTSTKPPLIIPGTGVDTSHFLTSQPELSPVQFIFAGRLIKDKGIEELLQASQEIYKVRNDFSLLVLGPPDPENPSGYTKEQWQEKCNLPFLKYAGFKKDIAPYLKESQVAILPSYREGFPLFLLEAGACGLPSITTDAPGCRALIKHKYNGLLVPIQDPKSLKLAMLTLLDSPTLRSKLGSNAQECVREQFNQNKILQLYMNAYGFNETTRTAA